MIEGNTIIARGPPGAARSLVSCKMSLEDQPFLTQDEPGAAIRHAGD
jgi:hypothetical protein